MEATNLSHHGAPNPTYKREIVQSQPSDSFKPWQFLAAADNEDNFDELLEQYQSTAGFEIVADTNLFLVKHRIHEKDAYTKVSKYDVVDGDCQQYLFVSSKDYNYRCFHLLISTTVSVFTDCYKDPIFITNSYFSAQQKHCCTITTINGAVVGTIDKQPSRTNTDANAHRSSSSRDYTIHNEYENSTLNLISTSDEDSSNFDLWDGTNCVATIARSDENTLTVRTTASLTSVNKILVLGFAFYVDGIYRGDDSGLNLYSLIGL